MPGAGVEAVVYAGPGAVSARRSLEEPRIEASGGAARQPLDGRRAERFGLPQRREPAIINDDREGAVDA